MINENNKTVVLITGAASGIGKACAENLAEKGYKVYGADRLKVSGKQTHQESSNVPTMIQMDVNDEVSVEAGINHILKKEGQIDVVVNNAGFSTFGAIEDTPISEAKSVFETNFFGVMRICRAVLPAMRKQQNGLIINISSTGGIMGAPFHGIYCASKFAVEGFSEALSLEVKPFGVKVVIVEPGDTKTGFTANRRKSSTFQINTVYKENFDKVLKITEDCEQQTGLSPYKIAKVVEKIIITPKPKLRYLTGTFLHTLGIYVKKFISGRWFEKIILRYYGIKINAINIITKCKQRET